MSNLARFETTTEDRGLNLTGAAMEWIRDNEVHTKGDANRRGPGWVAHLTPKTPSRIEREWMEEDRRAGVIRVYNLDTFNDGVYEADCAEARRGRKARTYFEVKDNGVSRTCRDFKTAASWARTLAKAIADRKARVENAAREKAVRELKEFPIVTVANFLRDAGHVVLKRAEYIRETQSIRDQASQRSRTLDRRIQRLETAGNNLRRERDRLAGEVSDLERRLREALARTPTVPTMATSQEEGSVSESFRIVRFDASTDLQAYADANGWTYSHQDHGAPYSGAKPYVFKNAAGRDARANVADIVAWKREAQAEARLRAAAAKPRPDGEIWVQDGTTFVQVNGEAREVPEGSTPDQVARFSQLELD